MVIWKYKLQCCSEQELELPLNAQILCVQVQNENPHLWVMCDPAEKRKETRVIYTFGTGHKFEELSTRKYIGTFQLQGGKLVFHVFDSPQ